MHEYFGWKVHTLSYRYPDKLNQDITFEVSDKIFY